MTMTKQRLPSVTAFKRLLRILTVLLGFGTVLFSLAQAQSLCPSLNLDFEEANSLNLPVNWTIPFVGSAGTVKVITDPALAYSGSASLLIQRFAGGEGASTATNVYTFVSTAALAGKAVTFSGYIRTQDLTGGRARLVWAVKDAEGLVSPESGSPGATGTQGWRRYSHTFKIDPAAVWWIQFGVQMSGTGKAWFDHLQITVGPDHVPIGQVLAKPQLRPTAAQLDWLKQNAIPLKGTDPSLGFGGLESLKAMIGNARIVGLGEATHGSHEIFQMKDRLVRFLVSQMGFTIFAIEFNMPVAYRLNEYVLHGVGDPKKLLIRYEIWDTQEVLNLVEWMRKYNASGKGKIEFTGFDMIQAPTSAERNVQDFIAKADPDYLPSLNNAYHIVDHVFGTYGAQAPQAQAEEWKTAAQKVYDHLEANQDKYLNKASAHDVAWAIQNARIVLQGAENQLPGEPSREESMAENVEWIAERNPGAKIVLWAHDMHIAKNHAGGAAYPRMGDYLAKHFGKDYVALEGVMHLPLRSASEQLASRADTRRPRNASLPTLLVDVHNP